MSLPLQRFKQSRLIIHVRKLKYVAIGAAAVRRHTFDFLMVTSRMGTAEFYPAEFAGCFGGVENLPRSKSNSSDGRPAQFGVILGPRGHPPANARKSARRDSLLRQTTPPSKQYDCAESATTSDDEPRDTDQLLLSRPLQAGNFLSTARLDSLPALLD
jgi:hypothetical protein